LQKPKQELDCMMLGVVLWSDASDGKAVIWCEDQGDLAYVNATDGVLRSGDFFDAGDLVQFDMEMCQSMRLANNPRLVIEKAGAELPRALLGGAISAEHGQCDNRNVIPFVRRTTSCRGVD
jgi:hypothetical protein